MAIPKKFLDKPGTSGHGSPKSTVSPYGSVSSPGVAFQQAKPFYNYRVAFIGKPGCGRNSLAWRMNNLNDSDLPALPFMPCREVYLETSTRPALRHSGLACMRIRIVPPDEFQGELFFHKRGGISECHLLVFIVDLGDDSSSNEFYTFFRRAQQKTRRQGMPPFVIVGNKVDTRLFGVATPYRWGADTATTYSARAYLECSARTNDRVGEVLETILRILL